MKNIEIHQEECGCIRSWWVRIPGEPARCCGHVHDITEEQAVEHATRMAKEAAREKEIEKYLQENYPGKQIFQGYLPSGDVEWHGEPDEYLYVLKDRRKGGKDQVETAIKLSVA